MRIVFCGTPEFSVYPLQKLVENNHNVVAVYTQPDRGVGRGRKIQYSAVKDYALTQSIPVYQPVNFKSEQAIIELEDLKPDLLVVVAYGLILPPKVLGIPTIDCWNIHASLLPKWRGAAPIHRALLSGDKTTGVGIMQMEAGLDTGPVFVQHECAIKVDEQLVDLHDRLARLGSNALLECLELLQNNLLPLPMIQDESKVSYAHKLKKEESNISWNQTALDIERKVRGLNPWPGVVAEINGESFKIWQVKPVEKEAVTEVGGIVTASKTQLILQCLDSQLEILSIQKPGKKRMDIQQFMQSRSDWFQ
jgi:methionyl-tRNA formyltransferase